MIHIGFTGTQPGMTGDQIRVVMQFLISLAPTDVHHGDCIGSDDDFHLITSLWDTPVRRHIHPPTNPTKRAWCPIRQETDTVYLPKPYLIRNHDIVDATTTLIATPAEYTEQLRSGTWSTIRYARKHRRHIIVVYPDGSTNEDRND